jgi:hypothetical protein
MEFFSGGSLAGFAGGNPFGGLIGDSGFLRNLFGANGQPMSDFGSYEQQLAQQYQPWANKGLDANNFLSDQWKQNAMNPSGLEDSLASHFQASRYQNNLMDLTTQRANANAANTGMLSSPASQNYLNSQLNNMTGQFQNDYINKGMQTYGMGMQGMNQIADRGLNALNQESGLAEQGAIAQMKAQQQNNSFLPNLLGTGIGIAGAIGGGGMFGHGSPSAGMSGGSGSMIGGGGLPGGVPYALNSPQMGLYNQGMNQGMNPSFGMNGFDSYDWGNA